MANYDKAVRVTEELYEFLSKRDENKYPTAGAYLQHLILEPNPKSFLGELETANKNTPESLENYQLIKRILKQVESLPGMVRQQDEIVGLLKRQIEIVEKVSQSTRENQERIMQITKQILNVMDSRLVTNEEVESLKHLFGFKTL